MLAEAGRSVQKRWEQRKDKGIITEWYLLMRMKPQMDANHRKMPQMALAMRPLVCVDSR
jgi:hypothetical protein